MNREARKTEEDIIERGLRGLLVRDLVASYDLRMRPSASGHTTLDPTLTHADRLSTVTPGHASKQDALQEQNEVPGPGV